MNLQVSRAGSVNNLPRQEHWTCRPGPRRCPDVGAQGRAVPPKPAPLLPTSTPVMATRQSTVPADPINHCTSPTQANRLGTVDRASCASTGLDPVLTSGRGEVAGRTRKLGSGSAQNSGSPTEPRCRSPGNAGPTRKSSAHLGNRAWRVWRRRRRAQLWRKRLRVASLCHCCARAVSQPSLSRPTTHTCSPAPGWLTWLPPCPALPLPGPGHTIFPGSLSPHPPLCTH